MGGPADPRGGSGLPIQAGIVQFVFSIRAWCLVGILLAAFLAWQGRNNMNPDGLNYLDMANASLVNGPGELIHGLRSPAYPAFLVLMIGFFHPAIENVDSLIHFANFILFSIALAAFVFFLKGYLISKSGSTEFPEDEKYLVPIGMGFFLLMALNFIGLTPVVPELMVMGVVFGIAGLCVRLGSDQRDGRRAALLGFFLGIGYYVKEPFLELGVLLLLLLAIFTPVRKFDRRSLFLATSVFLAISASLVTARSLKYGRFTVGDAARYNYLTVVNRIRNFGLDGSFGVLRHPPKILWEKPLVLDLDRPLPITFPYFYDPCYWMDGAKVKFELTRGLKVLQETLLADCTFLIYTCWFWIGAFLLAFSIPLKGFLRSFPARDRWMVLWALLACCMFSAIHVEYRYLAPFVALLGPVLYRGLLTRSESRSRRWVLRTIVLILVLLLPVPMLKWAIRTKTPHYSTMARELMALGLRPGDHLAVVGDDYDTYYVFLAGMRLTVKIIDADSFWKLDHRELGDLEDRLRSIGVKAILSNAVSPSVDGGFWKGIEGQVPKGVHVLLLDSHRGAETKKNFPGHHFWLKKGLRTDLLLSGLPKPFVKRAI